MNIESSEVSCYRNLKDGIITWHHGLCLMCGPNGSGKTNMLEALNMCAGWGTYVGPPSGVVRWGGTSGWVRCEVRGEKKITASVQVKSRASLRMDGHAARATDMRDALPVLSFTPGSMSLLEGSASYRRRMLDVVCALLYPLYAMRLHQYKRALRQRTWCLRYGESDINALRVIAPLSVWIWKARTAAASAMASCLGLYCCAMGCSMEMEYKRGGGGNSDDPAEDFSKSIQIHSSREKAARTPLVGPHRDDIFFTSQGRPAVSVFSRGYRRRAALSVMLAASEAVGVKVSKKPIMLLDEVTAELDSEGRKKVMDVLCGTGMQIFAATSDSPFDFDGQAYSVKEGEIKKI